jgi:hypothetical protein
MYNRPLMLFPLGNPCPRRQRHSVTALMLNNFRSIGPVIHWDTCDGALLRFDVEQRGPRRGLKVFAAFRELHLMGISEHFPAFQSRTIILYAGSANLKKGEVCSGLALKLPHCPLR